MIIIIIEEITIYFKLGMKIKIAVITVDKLKKTLQIPR